MKPPQDLWMPCPDGIRLATRLWRPEGDGPWPVLLMRQPYGRAIASTVTYAHPSWYAARGFLVAVQDVRGRGGSEGEFGGFSQEAPDGAAAVRWARRLDGSNGRVGLYGFSYQGLSQLLIAADEGPADGSAAADAAADPLPDCLAPACCGLDERCHWASEGGAHWWALGLGWALQLAAQRCRREGDHGGWLQIRTSLESGAFLRDGTGLLQRHDPSGMGLAWLRQDPSGAQGWRRHQPALELLRRPMLILGGWHDPHLRGTLDLWRRAREAGGDAWLRIGAWTHLGWDGDVDGLQLAFFRAHLQEGSVGASTTALPADGGGVGLADLGQRCALQCGEGGPWQPAAATGPLVWALHSDGLAARREDEGRLLPWPAAEAGDVALTGSAAKPGTDVQPGGVIGPGGGELTLVHDPWRPVPGRGGHLGLDAGCCERDDLDRRADVACFQSDPLPCGLLLQGQPRLALAVAADQPGFDLCAALSLVEPDGAVRQISTGVIRLLGDGCLRLRRRRVALQPLLRQLLPGQRLRLSLAAAAWPQIAVNPGSGEPPWGGVSAGHREITLRLELRWARLWIAPLFGAN